MAIFFDERGDVYFNGVIGLPGSDGRRIAYRLGTQGYRLLFRFYAVGLTLMLLVFVTAAVVRLTSIEHGRVLLLALSITSATFAVAAAALSLRFEARALNLRSCTGEASLSHLIYLFYLAVLATQALVCLDKQTRALSGVFVFLGLLVIRRMMSWHHAIRGQPSARRYP